MAENTWLKNEREYFASVNHEKCGIAVKVLNQILERYNKFLQKALLGESPFVAEDLKLTMLRSNGGEVVRKS